MPFTFSHPAIVLPLKNIFGKWVSLTGLIIGSLTPDFEYFFRMKMQSDFSHTLLGTLWFNLPLGIILSFVFHQIIKKPLIENSPRLIQSKLSTLKNFNWQNYFKFKWITVCLSILIGAYSHILWDSFTHKNAFFVNLFELDRTIGNSQITIFKALQHLSTFIGGCIILIYFFEIKTTDYYYVKPKWRYWLIVGTITILFICIKLSTNMKITEYGNVIVSGITAVMLALTIASIVELKI